MTILFFIIWAVLFALCVLAIAATPTTLTTPNSALILPAIVTGILAGLLTLVVAGAFSLFGG